MPHNVFDRTGDNYEENLVELVRGFTELIDRVQEALPNGPYKESLLRKLNDAKREATRIVLEELK